MPSFTSTLLLAAMASLSVAIKVTSPSKHQVWDSSKSNTITWSSVSTDAQKVDVYLVHMAAHPPLYSLLFSDVPTSQGSAVVSGLQLPNGNTYQINLVFPDNQNQILAQSEHFNVTGEAVAGATSTLDGYTGPAYTSTKSGTATKSASLTTVTTGTNSRVTGTSTATSEEANEGVSSNSTITRSPSQTVNAASGTASTSATRTGNAAAGNFVATGSLMAMFFGAAAFLA